MKTTRNSFIVYLHPGTSTVKEVTTALFMWQAVQKNGDGWLLPRVTVAFPCLTTLAQ